MALTQRDIKRLLAYSSISQAGYILVGACSASPLGASSPVFYLFAAAMEQGHFYLVLVGILTSTVSIYYCLIILRRLHIDEPRTGMPAIAITLPDRVVLAVTMAGILLLGLLPQLAADWTLEAGRMLAGGR